MRRSPPLPARSMSLGERPSASTSPIRSAWRRASTRTPSVADALLHRVRLHRGRHADAAPAARQSEAAAVPAAEDRAMINRFGFNNGGHDAARERASGAGGRAGGRRQHRRQQGRRRPRRRLCRRDRSLSPPSPAISPSTSPRPTRPACAICSSAARSTNSLARVLDARDAMAAGPRRPVLLKIAPDVNLGDLDDVVRGRARAWRRWHDRLQHHDFRPGLLARRRPPRERRPFRRAAVLAVDAHACSRPSCASRASFRSSGSAAWIARGGLGQDRSRRDARPACIPRWSMKASASSRVIKEGLVAHTKSRRLHQIGPAIGSGVNDWL